MGDAMQIILTFVSNIRDGEDTDNGEDGKDGGKIHDR